MDMLILEPDLEQLQKTVINLLAKFAHKELVRLTKDQAFVLDGLSGNKRLVVRGGAGTGKTLLIVARATKLAAEGKKKFWFCVTTSHWVLLFNINWPTAATRSPPPPSMTSVSRL